MPTKKRCTEKISNWTYSALKQVMDAITYQRMKVRVVVHTFGIPMSSLRDHLYGKMMGRKRGTKTMLGQEHDGKLFDYCFKM